MSTPQLNPNDLGTAHDLRVIIPSTAPLAPQPRCLLIAADGVLKWEAPGPLPDLPVAAGSYMMVRPLRILPGTTATVVALY